MKSTKYYQDLQARYTVGIDAQALESWEEGLLWTEGRILIFVEIKVIINYLDEGSCEQLATLH